MTKSAISLDLLIKDEQLNIDIPLRPSFLNNTSPCSLYINLLFFNKLISHFTLFPLTKAVFSFVLIGAKPGLKGLIT